MSTLLVDLGLFVAGALALLGLGSAVGARLRRQQPPEREGE